MLFKNFGNSSKSKIDTYQGNRPTMFELNQYVLTLQLKMSQVYIIVEYILIYHISIKTLVSNVTKEKIILN